MIMMMNEKNKNRNVKEERRSDLRKMRRPNLYMDDNKQNCSASGTLKGQRNHQLVYSQKTPRRCGRLDLLCGIFQRMITN